MTSLTRVKELTGKSLDCQTAVIKQLIKAAGRDSEIALRSVFT